MEIYRPLNRLVDDGLFVTGRQEKGESSRRRFMRRWDSTAAILLLVLPGIEHQRRRVARLRDKQQGKNGEQDVSWGHDEITERGLPASLRIRAAGNATPWRCTGARADL